MGGAYLKELIVEVVLKAIGELVQIKFCPFLFPLIEPIIITLPYQLQGSNYQHMQLLTYRQFVIWTKRCNPDPTTCQVLESLS